MTTQLKHRIGLRVKQARMDRHLTQAQLAERIDKAFETISNIERGKTYPNFQTLEDISLVLAVPMRDFFDIEEVGKDGRIKPIAAKRQKDILRIHDLIERMDDRELALWVKLGKTLVEHDAE